ncbi:MAG: hypothetical protein IKD69_01080 [Solobacterium sp.]|nr:hypothetical protein [Solobacterium sp.]
MFTKSILSIMVGINMLFPTPYTIAENAKSLFQGKCIPNEAAEAWDQFSKGNPEWDSYSMISYEPVYDVALNEFGVLMSFEDAYAIIRINQGCGTVLEAGKGESSPFGKYEGKKIYGSPSGGTRYSEEGNHIIHAGIP